MRKLLLLLPVAVGLAACQQLTSRGMLSGQLSPPRTVQELSLRPGTQFLPGEAIVRYRSTARALSAAPAAVPLSVAQSLDERTRVVRMPVAARALSSSAGSVTPGDPDGARTLEWISSLRAMGDVEFAIPNTIYRPLASNPAQEPAYANSPFYQKWHYDLAKVPAAWAQDTGSGNVVIAVLDTGIVFRGDASNESHPDFKCQVQLRPSNQSVAKMLPGYDFVQDDADPYDDSRFAGTEYHGTHVTGTAGACANGQGVTGVAPGTRLLPVRVMDETGGSLSTIAAAIHWAAGLPYGGKAGSPTRANVINLSLGSDEPPNPLMQGAINAANNAGSVVVVAAGNEGQNAAKLSPANQSGVIVVGAAAPNGSRASYSNRGGAVRLLAPGGTGSSLGAGIYSTLGCGQFSTSTCSPGATFGNGYHAGTSMAAPHVSGTVALMMSASPALAGSSPGNWVRVLAALIDSAAPVSGCGSKEGCGAGLLNAGQAVSLASQAPGPFLEADERTVELGSRKNGATLTLSNLGSAAGTWSVSTTGQGLAASPASLTLAPGESRALTVSLNRSASSGGSFLGRVTFSGPAKRGLEVTVDYEVGGPDDAGDLRVRYKRMTATGSAVDGSCRDVLVKYPYEFSFSSLEAGLYDVEAYRDTGRRDASGAIVADLYGSRSSVSVANDRNSTMLLTLSAYTTTLTAACR